MTALFQTEKLINEMIIPIFSFAKTVIGWPEMEASASPLGAISKDVKNRWISKGD